MKLNIIQFNKFLLTFILLFFNIFFVNAINFQVNISENSSITKLLSGQYSLQATGILELQNPSNFSKVYEFNIPLSLDALIGITKINIDNTSNNFEFKFDKIHGYFIEPNQTIKVKYKIFGLLNNDLYSIIKSKNISVLEYYSKPMEFSSNIKLFLQKPQREGFNYDINGTLISSPPPNTTTTRLISAGIKNPTDFTYFANEIKLYKTIVSDPFFRNGQIIKIVYNKSIKPLTNEIVDIFDYNSSDKSVYWVSSNFILNYTLNSEHNEFFSVEPQLGGGNSGSRSSGGSSFIIKTKHFYDSILLKKSTNKTIVKNGDEFKIFLRIVNVNNFNISNLLIYDFIPDGYEIKDVSSSVKISAGKLTFNVKEVGEYETYVISYTLKNKNELSGITYLKPAELIFKNDSIFSEGILLINNLLPEKKIFVQKEITYVNEKYARIVIKVKNLGSVKVENLLITDNINDNASIKEISKVFFKKGSWIIKSLNPGQGWEVSYLIDRNYNIDTLPNIFGAPKASIYGNLVSSEEIVTVFKEPPKTIEKVGMAFAVGLLVFYLLF